MAMERALSKFSNFQWGGVQEQIHKQEWDPVERLSRTLGWYLRHHVEPEKLHEEGWVDVEEMMKHLTFRENYSIQNIQDHVNNQGEYKQFELKDDAASGKLQIRSKHFHSREIKKPDWTRLTLETENLIVVYPTAVKSLEGYISHGFTPKDKNRTHLHFWSRDPDDESKVINAKKYPTGNSIHRNIFIYIDVKLAITDGLEFFQSDDTMVKTRGNAEGVLEPKYIEKVVDIVTGKFFSTNPVWTPITKEGNIPIVVDPTGEEYWREIVNQGFPTRRPWRENFCFWLGDPKYDNNVSGPASPFHIFMYIDVYQALNDGLEFFQSEDAMVKTRGNSNGLLEPYYIEKVVNIKTGEVYWKSPKRITSAVDGPILVHPALKSNWEKYKDRGFSPEDNKSYIRFMIRDPDNANLILGQAIPDAHYDVFIYIDLQRALTDGWKFFLRKDGSAMTLCDRGSVLDPKYIDKIVDLSTGKSLRFF